MNLNLLIKHHILVRVCLYPNETTKSDITLCRARREMVVIQKPVVSVVMPLYNKEADVRRAVESVLTQTVSDFELVIINDGSTDQGPDVVRKINDNRIRFFDQKNAGVSAARNRGINESRSALVAFLDADDEWKPDFLETILHLKEEFPSCSVFATNYVFREVNGKYHLPIIRGLPSHPWEGVLEDYFGVAVKSDPPVWTSAVAVTKTAIKSIGLFPVGVTGGEDLLTWARLAISYDIAYTSQSKSIFCLRVPITGSPIRLYDNIDIVGPALVSLLQKAEEREKNMLEEYIALWHRMRASTYLQIGHRHEAISEIKKMRHFSKRNLLFYLYSTVSIMPGIFFNITVKGLSLIKTFRRMLYPSGIRNCITVCNTNRKQIQNIVPIPYLWMAHIYCNLYVLIKRNFGKNLRGFGSLTRKINRDYVLMVNGKKLFLNHKVAGSYGTLISGVWNEPETHQFIRNLLFPSTFNFIDVGANVGEMIVDIASFKNVKHVIAFEPHAECAKTCEISAKINEYSNVKIVQKAIGTGKPVKFNFDAKSPNSSQVMLYGNEGEIIPTATLDNELCDLSTASIILIDVQGYEPEVLEGGRKFIQSNRPLIIFEYNQLSKKHFNLDKIHQIIGIGFEIFRLRHDGYLDKNVENAWNCVAIHSESVFFDSVRKLINS